MGSSQGTELGQHHASTHRRALSCSQWVSSKNPEAEQNMRKQGSAESHGASGSLSLLLLLPNSSCTHKIAS